MPPTKPASVSTTTRRRFDLARLKTISLRERKSLVSAQQFAQILPPIPGFRRFVESLPDIHAGAAFKTLVKRIVAARQAKAPVVLGLGAHVVKCGVGPIVIDLMRKEIVSAVAMNGAGAIHDVEVALVGETSEDVGANLRTGTFGMAREAADVLNRAARKAQRLGVGFGRALGDLLLSEKGARPETSIAAEAARLDVAFTLHVCLGADTVHLHPGTDGAALGAACLRDFHKLCEIVARMDGGVFVNVGCAVVLPEVFLKAVAAASNLGFTLDGICTADLDMTRHYRPQTNVVERPPGEGLSIAGQHEILLPLLRLAVLSYLED